MQHNARVEQLLDELTKMEERAPQIACAKAYNALIGCAAEGVPDQVYETLAAIAELPHNGTVFRLDYAGNTHPRKQK